MFSLHVLIRRYAHRAPPYDAYTHILLRLSLILCLTWLKKDVRCFLCPLRRKKLPPTPTDPPYILQLSFHSWLFVFTFLFFDLRRRCVAYLPSFILYIYMPQTLLPPAEKNRFYLLTYFQPVAGGTYTQKEEKKQTASHSIILRHHPKPIPSSPTRLTLLLCNFVRPLPRSIKSSLFQAKPFDSM